MGVGRVGVSVPMPHWPRRFEPADSTMPSSSRNRACSDPVAICIYRKIHDNMVKFVRMDTPNASEYVPWSLSRKKGNAAAQG
jgi:hypothetical protein